MMDKMMLRRVLLFPRRIYPWSDISSLKRILLESRHMSYSSGLPIKYFTHRKSSSDFSPIFSSFVFTNICLNYSSVSVLNKVDSLSKSILSGNAKIYDSDKTGELKKIIQLLFSKGYSNKDIKEKFLDYLKSQDCSYTKFCILFRIDSDIAMLLPLLSLPMSVLRRAADKAENDKKHVKEFSNRILYLSYHLELDPYELIPILAKHSSLLTMNFERLDYKMKILKNAHICSKYIVKDLWIFNYTEEALASRIQAASEAGLELKPWMLRCSEAFFKSMLFKYSETQRILNGDTLEGYLAKRLNCSIEYVNFLMEKNKLLKSINVPKLEQVINLLYEKGYTSAEVRLYPRVFSSSVKTLEKRFEELHPITGNLPYLTLLCLSEKKLKSWLKEHR